MLSPGILSLVSINAIVLICVCPAPLFTPRPERARRQAPRMCLTDSSSDALINNVPRGVKVRERGLFFRSVHPYPALFSSVTLKSFTLPRWRV
jgi:hypothetical protein